MATRNSQWSHCNSASSVTLFFISSRSRPLGSSGEGGDDEGDDDPGDPGAAEGEGEVFLLRNSTLLLSLLLLCEGDCFLLFSSFFLSPLVSSEKVMEAVLSVKVNDGVPLLVSAWQNSMHCAMVASFVSHMLAEFF